MSMIFERKLPIPQEVKELYPLSLELETLVEKRKIELKQIFEGKSEKLVKGFMIESYIEDGAQKIGENVWGKSITDPCLGWEKTEKLILKMAELL